MHPAELPGHLQGLEDKVGLGHQQLTRLYAPGSGPRLRPQCAPLIASTDIAGINTTGREGVGSRGTSWGPFQEARTKRQGRDALRARKSCKPGSSGSYLRAWGAGTPSAAAASGLPVQLEQLGRLEEGKARGLAARNSPTRLLGGAGRRRSAALQSLCRRPFYTPRFLNFLLPKFPNSAAVICRAHASVLLT